MRIKSVFSKLLGFSVHTINVVVDSALNYSTITAEASGTGGLKHGRSNNEKLLISYDE